MSDWWAPFLDSKAYVAATFGRLVPGDLLPDAASLAGDFIEYLSEAEACGDFDSSIAFDAGQYSPIASIGFGVAATLRELVEPLGPPDTVRTEAGDAFVMLWREPSPNAERAPIADLLRSASSDAGAWCLIVAEGWMGCRGRRPTSQAERAMRDAGYLWTRPLFGEFET